MPRSRTEGPPGSRPLPAPTALAAAGTSAQSVAHDSVGRPGLRPLRGSAPAPAPAALVLERRADSDRHPARISARRTSLAPRPGPRRDRPSARREARPPAWRRARTSRVLERLLVRFFHQRTRSVRLPARLLACRPARPPARQPAGPHRGDSRSCRTRGRGPAIRPAPIIPAEWATDECGPGPSVGPRPGRRVRPRPLARRSRLASTRARVRAHVRRRRQPGDPERARARLLGRARLVIHRQREGTPGKPPPSPSLPPGPTRCRPGPRSALPPHPSPVTPESRRACLLPPLPPCGSSDPAKPFRLGRVFGPGHAFGPGLRARPSPAQA